MYLPSIFFPSVRNLFNSIFPNRVSGCILQIVSYPIWNTKSKSKSWFLLSVLLWNQKHIFSITFCISLDVSTIFLRKLFTFSLCPSPSMVLFTALKASKYRDKISFLNNRFINNRLFSVFFHKYSKM